MWRQWQQRAILNEGQQVLLQQDVVDHEMRLALYDDSSHSLLVLDSLPKEALARLHTIVREVVHQETLLVNRHGSQLLRVPKFSRQPNRPVPPQSDAGVAQLQPMAPEARLRLLRARLALAEHRSTKRTYVAPGDDEQEKILARTLAHFASRLAGARGMLEVLSRAHQREVVHSMSNGSGEGGKGLGAADSDGQLAPALAPQTPWDVLQRGLLYAGRALIGAPPLETVATAPAARPPPMPLGARQQGGAVATQLDVAVQLVRYLDIDFVFVGVRPMPEAPRPTRPTPPRPHGPTAHAPRAPLATSRSAASPAHGPPTGQGEPCATAPPPKSHTPSPCARPLLTPGALPRRAQWYRLRVSVFASTARNALPAPLISATRRVGHASEPTSTSSASSHEFVSEWFASPMLGCTQALHDSLHFKVVRARNHGRGRERGRRVGRDRRT